MGDGVVRWLRAASSVWSLHVRLCSLRCSDAEMLFTRGLLTLSLL
jgi:hypothetical protein